MDPQPEKTLFLQALQLSPDLGDEECTRSITNLVTQAVGEQCPTTSLTEIHEAVARYGCAEYLEPLDVLSKLFPCRHDGALDLIRLCGLSHSPKELMIVIQAAIVQLKFSLDEDDPADESVSDFVPTIIGITTLCGSAISRSRLGKKSALETCSPVLESMTPVISAVSPFATRAEGRLLVIEVARLVKSLGEWASAYANASEAAQIKDLLRGLLDATVIACAPSIQACLAVRAVESRFPRFSVKSSVAEGWQEGEKAMSEVQIARRSIGEPLTKSPQTSTLVDLMYLAHSTLPKVLSPSTLTDLNRLLVHSLHMNVMVDESLFLLFRMLSQENMQVLPEVVISLCAVFPALASTNLDPFIRQLTLRLLSWTLAKLPPPARREILLSLATDEDFPQIRGPAVGLLKEAVVEALALSENVSSNPFASEELLRVFGRVLFKPNPPEFFTEKKTNEELAQSLELLRIADCLSFYYVLLQRDRENKTGVRSKGNITSVQGTFLRPLRKFLDEHIAHEERPLMVITSLQVGLDRIDDALRALDISS